MCSGGALSDHCFGGFALCVPTAWSPSCLPCEESVRVLLSSDHVSQVIMFHIVTMCVVNALIKGEIEDQERPRTSVVAP